MTKPKFGVGVYKDVMLFAVDYDKGFELEFYVIPDDAGTTPSVILRNDGADVLEMSANYLRNDTVASGRHSSGQCGFFVDTEMLPALSAYQSLEIIERETGVMIYRRPQPDDKEIRLFRLETHLLPLWRIDDALKPRFQYWYKGVDRRGAETASQSFNVLRAQSLYVSGRIYFKTIEPYLSQGFQSIALFRDPYTELAERLIILKNIGEQANELLGPRDAMVYGPVISELAGFDAFDHDACQRFFQQAPPEVSTALANPFIRQLTAASPNDDPPAGCLGMALQTLSDFAVLGVRAEPERFSRATETLFGFEPGLVPVMKEFAKVVELGDTLREIGEARSLLEQDLEMFQHLEAALEEQDEAMRV